MADKAATTAKTTAAKTVKVGDFQFDTALDVPAMTRGARSSEMGDKLKAMPVGASFLEAVAPAAATIKDEGERDKVFKENARTVSNRLSGAIRRFKKNNPEGYEFAMRTVNDPVLGQGVRVWRVEAAKA